MSTWQQITDEERGPAPTDWTGLEDYWAAGLGCTAQMARQWQRYGFSPAEAVEYYPTLKIYNDSPAGTAKRRQYSAGVAEIRDMIDEGIDITQSTISQYMRRI